MNIVTVDLETMWAPDYSLSKMSPLEYVMDERFEIISCAIKFNHHPTDVFFGEAAVRRAFAGIEGTVRSGLLLGHNMSGFDAYVCAYRLGLRPRMWGCTMAMARPLHAKTTGVSLAKLVEHYRPQLEAMGIAGVKDNTALVQTRGKRLADFTPAELDAMREYNRNDTDQCWGLFRILRKHYTSAELWQIDALTRMRTEPQFVLDTPLLEAAASVERSRKHAALLDAAKHLRAAGAACSELDWSDEAAVAEFVRAETASSARFAALLTRLGVEVPMKPSPTNPEHLVPALAKTDEAFLALQEHPDPVVASAARTRLDVKSTILETRIQKFLTAGALAGGRIPVPLRYCGADTTGRDSGEEYNCFTGDVEVLTRDGWVRFDEWGGAPIMQWWPDGRATFEETPGVLRKHYAGEMVNVRGVLLDACMTPEHRLVTVRGGKVVERSAAFLRGHTGLDNIPVAGTWGGADSSAYTPDEARLMVAIAADGCVIPRATTRPGIKIGLRRQRKIDRLRGILDAVGIPYTVREYPPQATHKGEHNTVQFYIPDCPYPKGFGSWLLHLSRAALDAVVEEIPHWDGWCHHKTGAHEFSSGEAEQAAWVATAWHLSNTPTTMRNYGGRWQLHRRRPGSRTSVQRSDVERVTHDGTVYCASVESTYIFIRRNGKIAVTGQCQNLPRVNPGRPATSDALRKSLRAPKGHLVIVADQSGIELRVNHFLWKVPSSMALYRASPDKADLYRTFAAENLYKVRPEEITETQRNVGKIAQLGLQFGSAAATFQRVAKIMGGLDLELERGPDTGPELTAQEVVSSWRDTYYEIVQGWRTCDAALGYIYDGREVAVDPWELVVTAPEGFRLPSGRLIRYPDLRREADRWPDGRPRNSWVYAAGRHKTFIHGSKSVENLVQALARDSVFDCSLEFFRRTGLRPALRVHDELVYVVPEARAQELLDELQAVMRTPPTWWPDLVVWSKGDAAPSYGEAK